jgi:hypothetical protein
MTRTILAIVALTLAGLPAAVAASGPSTVAALMNAHWGDEFHPGGMDGRVTALQVIGNDLYVGGEFTAVGAVPAQYVARYDGSAWHTLGDGTAGPVDALGTFQGDLVVGGSFLAAGSETTESVARWDGANWHALGTGLESGPVAFVEEDGRLIAGGPFLWRGRAPCDQWFYEDGSLQGWTCWPVQPWLPFVASWSGSQWNPEGPAPPDQWPGHGGTLNAYPRGFVRFRGDLYAYGDFNDSSYRLGTGNYGYVPAQHCGLARRTQDGWEHEGPPQSVPSEYVFPHVRAALAAGDSLILGGMNLTGGPGPADHVAAWDGTSLHPLGDGLDNTPVAFALYQGRIVAAGAFTHSGSTPLNHVAWWDGTSWRPFGDGLDGLVRALAVYDGMLIAGGDFEASGGRKMRYLAAWRDSAWVPLYRNPGGGLARLVLSISSYENQPVILEDSESAIWQREIASPLAWNAGSWVPLGSDTPIQPAGADPIRRSNQHGVFNDARFLYPSPMIRHRGELVTCAQATVRYHLETRLSRWDGASWTQTVLALNGPGWLSAGTIRSLLSRGDSLIVGGIFTSAGGIPGDNVAVLNDSVIRPLGAGLSVSTSFDWHLYTPMNWGVQALATYRGRIVAGGVFDRSGETVLSNVAEFDGSAWHGLGTGVNEAVTALAVYRDQLYAGGFFTEAGGGLASHLARWDGAGWHPVQGGTDGPIFAMAVYHGRLVAAGLFTEAGGRPARNVAAFDGAEWATLGSGVDGIVNGLVVIGDDLYLGGDFWEAGGKGADHVARWTDGPAEATLSDLRAERVPRGAHIRAAVDYLPVGHRDFRLWRQSYGEPRAPVATGPLTGASIDVVDPSAPDAGATYWIEERTAGGGSTMLGPIPLAPPAGLALTLAQNRPNPFAGSTRIAYRVPVEGTVDLAVFDVAGRRVAVLLHDRVPPGEYEASWDGHDAEGRPAATGIYFYRLHTPAGTLTRKLVKTE